MDVNAEIIAIGTEILLGEITDTNSVFIARVLRDLGINVYFMTSVGDNEGRIAEVIRLALGRAQIVITCGGLGPTIDDMTRQAVAAATERGLTFHQPLLDKIAARFVSFGATMTENNQRQAFVPDNAIIIENPVGTAPSFVVEMGDKCVISLPGVPREMKYLMNEAIVPYLREHYALAGTIIKARVLKTAGIGESMLDERIGKDLLEAANPTVGLAAHSGQVDVRITAKAGTEREADRLIADYERIVRERIGEYIFGVDSDTLEHALITALQHQNASVAISETGVGPIISNRLRNLPDGINVLGAASEHTSSQALADYLGLAVNVPIRQLAERAAEDAAKSANVTVGIAVVSHSQDNIDRADSEEQSALAVYVDGTFRSRAYGFAGGTEVVRQWAGTWAMSMAWRMLVERQAAAS